MCTFSILVSTCIEKIALEKVLSVCVLGGNFKGSMQNHTPDFFPFTKIKLILIQRTSEDSVSFTEAFFFLLNIWNLTGSCVSYTVRNKGYLKLHWVIKSSWHLKMVLGTLSEEFFKGSLERSPKRNTTLSNVYIYHFLVTL